MRNSGSIRFKLITLYVCLLAFVFLCFGAYTYWGFRQFLIRSLDQTLLRRADQIATSLLDELPARGAPYVANEIQARYAPELNERVIRITDAKGHDIYLSKNGPSEREVFTISHDVIPGKAVFRDEAIGGLAYRFVVLGHRLPNGEVYTIEVGAPESDMGAALRDLVFTLLLGFPVLIGLAVLGGYSLLGRALRPVDEIVGSAERITFKNLNERLPVPKTDDEFERISQALNRMIERLDEAFQIATRFSGDASHELRTPLTVIQGEMEALVHDPLLPPEYLERAANVLEEVQRLSRIVEGLLLVSRLDAGEAQMKMYPIDLGALVVSTAEQMELLSKDKLLTLRFETAPETMVEGDELRLRQVVVNLLDNAIKYTPEGGTVTLRVYAKAGQAVLEVIDTGIGISSEALPRVFNRFFRAEEARAGYVQGSGLGLAIVQSIIEAHRGSVRVESHENQGAKFHIELPLLPQAARKKSSGAALAV